MHLNKITLCPHKYPTREYYPFNLRIFNQTKSVLFSSPVTFFVGENGTGKSTLLKAICQRCGIHIWEGTQRTRFEINPYEEKLHGAIDVEWVNGPVPGSFFSSDIFKNFAQLLDEWAVASPEIFKYFGGKSLMTQSHGQSLNSFFKSRYQIKGIYLMDEPETALSPKSQLELLKVLKRMSQAKHAQFIIASHSPILLACPGAEIYSFDDIPIKRINYEQTEYYQVYRNFLNNRDEYLDGL